MPAFYRREPGAVLSTTIDKYMYVAIHPFFDKHKIQLKYSKTELVESVGNIQHPIFREVLRMYGLQGVDLNSIADIPSGTGLGSSSAFTVGLLNAVRTYLGKATGGEKLGQLACDVEINRIGSPIGKQDQYAAACGGLNVITFYGDETVDVQKIIMSYDKKRELEQNLFLYYIGGEHSANEILKQQQQEIAQDAKFQTQCRMVELVYRLKKSLEEGSVDDMGTILHEGWLLKKSLFRNISNSGIDNLYDCGIRAGATGGKLLGAGGAGFLLFYCPADRHETFKIRMQGFSEMPFRFDNYGSKIIYIGDKYE